MGQTIKKLNELNHSESFIQINTFKGFEYVDKAGALVNYYYNNNSQPVFDMGLNGLAIKEPRDKINELRITPQMIWMKFIETDSLDMVKDLFIKDSSYILNNLNIDEVNRIGWRNSFIFEFETKEKQEKYFKNLSKLQNGVLSFVRFELNIDKDFKVNLMIQSVVKNNEKKTPAVLFDIDIYKTDKIKIDDISKVLKNFKEYLNRKDEFLKVINDTFI